MACGDTKGQLRRCTTCVTCVLCSPENAEVGGSIPPSPTAKLLVDWCFVLTKLHRRKRSYGWFLHYCSDNRLGLVNLNGLVVAPRPNVAWRSLVAAHRR